MTSFPTNVPSRTPSQVPTTAIPSAAPSMSGWVATVSTSTATTEEIDSTIVDDYISQIATIYGVDPSDITSETAYATSGSMQMTIPIGVSEDEVIDAVTASIAEALGVHPQDVDVLVNVDTGDVQYTVTSDNYSDAAGNQFDLANDIVRDGIIASIESVLPSATVDGYEVSEDVDATLTFTVDADDALNDLTQAAFQANNVLSDFGEVDIESNLTHYFRNIRLKDPGRGLFHDLCSKFKQTFEKS